jgi:hypothetical protein
MSSDHEIEMDDLSDSKFDTEQDATSTQDRGNILGNDYTISVWAWTSTTLKVVPFCYDQNKQFTTLQQVLPSVLMPDCLP